MLRYTVGGTMSGHLDLRINLRSGAFELAEGGSPTPQGQVAKAHSGVIDHVQMQGLRETALFAIGNGLKSRYCIVRDKAARRRRLFFVDMPPTPDYLPSMYIALDNHEATAPHDPGCWSAAAVQLSTAALLAARSSAK
ncbi:MAG TPA: hypothetical protein VL918_09995 [Sphingobium sp.]|nr:hypothetical protein [Sphingobium sp.]